MKFLLRVIFFFLFLNLSVLPVFSLDEEYEEIDIEELRRRIFNEDPSEFLNYSIGDANVSLFFTGSWMGGFTFNPGFSKSPFGLSFSSPETPFLFKQEADITLSLWINDKWFVEANFLDTGSLAGSNLINTYRAGYEGFPGDFFQYAGIGNTGLDFPSFANLDLGGESPSSFGFYSRFGPENLTFHSLVRYDFASREERLFSGGRERTYHDMSPDNFLRGVSFVLPDTDISTDIIVYIEDEVNGVITDVSGRRWRIALPGEYAAGRTVGLLELSQKPDAMVAVYYSDGNYDTADFLDDVKNIFDDKIDLSNYPRKINFGGISALLIYEPGTFSPFEKLNAYRAPQNAAQNASLVVRSTGIEIKGFQLIQRSGALLELLISESDALLGSRSIYELLRDGTASDRRSLENMWPLAEDYPEIYIPPVNLFTQDMSIRFTSYSSVHGFYIGADVISGSVQVWRNGVQESGFSYNSSTGEVTINGNVSENDLVRITYLRKNSTSGAGSIAAGFGVIYDNKPFSAQAAAGIRWNITSDVFSEKDHSNMGTIGISAKAAWDYDFLSAHIAAAFTYAQTDTTGLYRVAGMEGNESVLYLPPESSFISNPPTSSYTSSLANSDLKADERADLTYRNYYDNNFLGSSLKPVEWNAPVVSGINRPYPVKDNYLNRQLITAEFTLDSTRNWTGFQVPLVYGSEIMPRAQVIEIPFRLYDFSGSTSDLKIIVQIGSLSSRDSAFTENPDLIWEEFIYPNNNPSNVEIIQDGQYQITRIRLSDDDRRRLTDVKFLRIIIVNESGVQISGRFMLAPPVIRGSSFRAVNFEDGIIKADNGNVFAAEVLDAAAEDLLNNNIVSRLHSNRNTQRALKIEWEDLEHGAGVDSRFQNIPLSDYRQLSFFFRPVYTVKTDDELRFVIASGPDSIDTPQLSAVIPMIVFTNNKWSKVTICYQGSGAGVYVDGSLVATATVDYNPHYVSFNETGRTSYIAILLDPVSNPPLNNGFVYIDEIILEDAIKLYRMNAGASFEYSKPGTLVSFNSLTVLSNFSFFSKLESEARIENQSADNQIQAGVTGRTGASVSLLGARITGNFSFNASAGLFDWNADHAVSRTFGLFSVNEKFYTSPAAQTTRHNIRLSFNSGFHADFSASSLLESSRLRQNWTFDIGYRSPNELIPVISLKTDASNVFPGTYNDNNYAFLWLSAWEDLLPNTGSQAQSRREGFQITLTQRTRPVGAVLTLDGRVNYTDANNVLNMENSNFISIPVILDKININFRAGRSFSRSLNYKSGDILNDTGKFTQFIDDSLVFWSVFPFYSMFADNIHNAMDKSTYDSPSSDLIFFMSFKDHFSAVVNLPASYNLASLFIPVSLSLRLERSLVQRMDTRSDILNISGSLRFSSINLFGAMGYKPVFSFYMADEFTHIIDAGFVIPKEGNYTWRAQSAISAGFRGFTGGVLSFKNTLSLRTNGWTESFISQWETPTNRSLTSILYDLIASSLKKQSAWLLFAVLFDSEYEQMRRESFEISFNKTDNYLSWNAAASHEEIVRILGRLNFSTFIKLALNQNIQTSVFSFNLQLGINLRIIF